MNAPTRPYRSSVRADAAAATRARILDVAARLFEERGYAATSISAVAKAAEVAAQTVYNVAGTKPGLLKATYDRVLVGDDEPVPLADRPRVRELYAVTDAEELLRGYADLGRDLLERVGPLMWQVAAGAAGGDPDLVALQATMADERRSGTLMVARRVADLGALAPDLSVTHARDRIWALNSVDMWRLLTDPVVGAGWSGEEYSRWIGEAMCDAVLRVRRPPAG